MSKVYNHRWAKARAAYLAKHPLCVYCMQMGKVVAAEVVDHIKPHKGDMTLFWDLENNVQSLCKHCHDSHKQRQERSGVLVGSDTDGQPVDPGHHWNR